MNTGIIAPFLTKPRLRQGFGGHKLTNMRKKPTPAGMHRNYYWLLVFGMMVCAFTTGHATAYAISDNQTITLNVQNAPLEKVFSEIEKQTHYNFLYMQSLVRKAKNVTIKITNATIEKVLEICFKDQPQLTYSIMDNVVIVKPKGEASPRTPSSGGGVAPSTEANPPIDVSGRVLDDQGKPLAGANVKVKGSDKGTFTDAEGRFTLHDVSENAVLEVTYVGHEPQSIYVRGKSLLVINLQPKTSMLDETVVIAYGTTTKRLNTGDVSSVKAKDIEMQPVNNPLLALEGRVPGLFITQANGIPGGGVTVTIQGQNSILNGNNPFYVIDGIPYPSLNLQTTLGGGGSPILGKSNANTFSTQGSSPGNPLSYINPADIESIEILKDADATAIYGSRAANGAILITTKKGKAGKTKFDFNLQQGFGVVGHFIDLLNTQQYMEMRKEAKKNDNGTISLTSDFDLNGLWDSTSYTNWQKTLIGGTAHINQYDASISGGTNIMQFLVGGTYRRESTVFPGDFSNQSGSIHININSTSNNGKFKAQISNNYALVRSNLPALDFTQYIFLAPVAPSLFNADGTLNWAPNTITNGSSSWMNPLAQLYNLYDNKTSNLVSNLVLDYRILPGFDIKSSFGYMELMSNEFVGQLIKAVPPENRPNYTRSANFSFNTTRSWIIEPQASYDRNFSKAKLNILFGGSIQQQDNDGRVINASGQPNDQLLKDFKSATAFSSTSSDINTYKYNGVFGRLNFIWNNKYIFDCSARRDGSSRFGDKNKFHNFGSVGLGWIFTEENFVKRSLHFISFGKLKGSYGTTGSDQIPNYAYLSTYRAQSYNNPYQDVTVSTLLPNGLNNPYLQWEETRKLQAGVELGIYRDRVFFSTVFSHNRSFNQLIGFPLSSVTGFTSVTGNLPAIVENIIWEFSITTKNISNNQFSWNSAINLTVPKNKLVSFPNLETSSFNNTLFVGKAIGTNRTYPFYGVDPLTGIFLIVDVNGNPVVTPNSTTDRTVFYSPLPKFYGGIENNISFGKFQIDFLVQFVKQEGVNTYSGIVVTPGNFGSGPTLGQGNQPADVLKRWQKPGDISVFQKFSATTIASTSGSRNLMDISYLRLKNASISYQLPDLFLRKIHVQSIRFFLNAQNILTMTSYKGLDPESLGNASLPPLKVITAGVHIGL